VSSSTTAKTSTSLFSTGAFWERLWRISGIVSALLFVVAYVVYGYQPRAGASADELAAFYDGNRTGILIAAIFAGNAVLFLLWFVAALKTALAEAGQDGWGAAATAASAAVGVLFLLMTMVGAALAYSITGSGDEALASALNDFTWACAVVSSFPRAMLIISNALFAIGVAAVVLVFLGGTTWLSGGFWAPDGVYARFVTPIIGLVWIIAVSRILLTRTPASSRGW